MINKSWRVLKRFLLSFFVSPPLPSLFSYRFIIDKVALFCPTLIFILLSLSYSPTLFLFSPWIFFFFWFNCNYYVSKHKVYKINICPISVCAYDSLSLNSRHTHIGSSNEKENFVLSPITWSSAWKAQLWYMGQLWKEDNQRPLVTNREHKPAYQQPKLTGKSPEKPKK